MVLMGTDATNRAVAGVAVIKGAGTTELIDAGAAAMTAARAATRTGASSLTGLCRVATGAPRTT